MKVINAHWDSHGSVGGAFGSCLLVACVSSAFTAVQIILRVLLHIVVDDHVVWLPDFSGSSTCCIVVTLFVYLVVVVSTAQRLLVVSAITVLYGSAPWSLRSLVVAAVQRIHY